MASGPGADFLVRAAASAQTNPIGRCCGRQNGGSGERSGMTPEGRPEASSIRHYAAMEPTFSTKSDGVIDIELGSGLEAFTSTLMDAVTTRAPGGSDGA